jgi:selenocysteine lyase/cysteine desulfurase
VSLTRAELLARAGLAAGAATLAGSSAEDTRAARERLDPSNWGSVRAQFAIPRDVHHLSGFVLAPHPRPVRAAIETHRRGLDRDPSGYLHARQGALEAAVREAAALYLGAQPDEFALTDSTTMGLGLLYAGLRLRPGEEILTTEHDFYATHEALRLRGRRTGARVRRIRLYERIERASVDEIVSAVRRALTPRTRVVAVTWVHSSTGLKLPIRAIADALPERVLLCVDGVHGLGVENETARSLGCDFLVSGCHKWLHGPRGTGIVWARASAWAETTATIPSFDDGASYAGWLQGRAPGATSALTMTPGGYHSFEHRWALSKAFDFHRSIGKARIEARLHGLAGRLKDGLADMRHVTLRTPRGESLSAAIVCFEVERAGASEAVERLARRRVVATVTPYATRYVRLGPGLYSSEDDVDAALAAVRTLV